MVVLRLVERGEEREVVPVSIVLVAHVVAHSVRKERQYNYVGLAKKNKKNRHYMYRPSKKNRNYMHRSCKK